MHRALSGAPHARARGFYTGTGFCPGAERSGDWKYHVYQSQTGGRSRYGKGDSHLWACLHSAGISENGLWKEADGAFLCTGRAVGVRRDRYLRKPRQLCGVWIPKLQKISDQRRRRTVSGGHDGEGTLPACAGRKKVGVSWQPCNGIFGRRGAAL